MFWDQFFVFSIYSDLSVYSFSECKTFQLFSLSPLFFSYNYFSFFLISICFSFFSFFFFIFIFSIFISSFLHPTFDLIFIFSHLLGRGDRTIVTTVIIVKIIKIILILTVTTAVLHMKGIGTRTQIPKEKNKNY